MGAREFRVLSQSQNGSVNRRVVSKLDKNDVVRTYSIIYSSVKTSNW
jgi:hypothetical protein